MLLTEAGGYEVRKEGYLPATVEPFVFKGGITAEMQVNKVMAANGDFMSIFFNCTATFANYGQPKRLILYAEGPLSFTTYFYHTSLSARRQGTAVTCNTLKGFYTTVGSGLPSVFGDW